METGGWNYAKFSAFIHKSVEASSNKCNFHPIFQYFFYIQLWKNQKVREKMLHLLPPQRTPMIDAYAQSVDFEADICVELALNHK